MARCGQIVLVLAITVAATNAARAQSPDAAAPVERIAALQRPIPLDAGNDLPVLPPPYVSPQPMFVAPPTPPPGGSCPFPPPQMPECAASHLIEYCSPSGCKATLFPGTLLWEPPLAQKDEPRFELLPNTLNSATSQNTLDTYIGGTAGLYRFTAPNDRFAVQVDFFGVVAARISQYDYMIANDFRAGLPITFAYGPWHAKIGYEHTSSHLGDDLMVMTGLQPIPAVKDEVVLGLGRWCWDQLRIYGEFGYAVSQNLPIDADPIRFNFGLEWRTRQSTGWWGRPFGAANIEFRGDQQYDPNFTVQLGWMWRNPYQRLGCVRLFGEYFTGHAPYQQLFQERNEFFGLGLAIDY